MLASLLVAGPSLAAQFSLTWTDNATNESGTRIERSSEPPGHVRRDRDRQCERHLLRRHRGHRGAELLLPR
jgi:hypothetical protein